MHSVISSSNLFPFKLFIPFLWKIWFRHTYKLLDDSSYLHPVVFKRTVLQSSHYMNELALKALLLTLSEHLVPFLKQLCCGEVAWEFGYRSNLNSNLRKERNFIWSATIKPPNIFFSVINLRCCPQLLWQKSFWPWIFPSDVVPFQRKEVGRFFGPWMAIIQENGSSLLCDVISVFHSCAKQTQTKRDAVAFFFTKCLIRV